MHLNWNAILIYYIGLLTIQTNYISANIKSLCSTFSIHMILSNAVIDTLLCFTSVNPTHRAFKAKIAEIIKKKIVYVEGKELESDSVISILEKELPECKGLSRTSLLRNASAILGCKLTHKGKPRYVNLSGKQFTFMMVDIMTLHDFMHDSISCVLFF